MANNTDEKYVTPLSGLWLSKTNISGHMLQNIFDLLFNKKLHTGKPVHKFHPVYETHIFIFTSSLWNTFSFHGNLQTVNALVVLSVLQAQVY
jgi:hypothetical protein